MTSETFLPRMGGAEIHVANLSRLLVEQNHEVVLVTNEIDAMLARERTKGVEVISMPWSRSRMVAIVRVLWAQAKRADVIHSHYSYRLATLAGIIGLLQRKPVIVTLHGLGTLNEAGARFPYTLVHAMYRRLSLGLAKRIISTSEDLARVAARYTDSRKMIVIPNGYDSDVFRPGREVSAMVRARLGERPIILTVRRLVPKNGIQYLIEALPSILKRHPDAHCVCIGDGRMRPHIESRISALGIGEAVSLLGEVDNATVPEYLSAARVIVFPSTAESVSIACAEAMGSGVPVVASRVGGLIELLGEDSSRGRLVALCDWTESDYNAPLSLPSRKYEMLADAVCEVLEQAKVPGDARAQIAILYAQKELAWRVVVEKILAQYLIVCAQNH